MKKILFLLCCVCLITVSCHYEVSDIAEDNVRTSRQRRARAAGNEGGVDMTPFFDVTLKNVDAGDVVVDEVFEMVKGKSYHCGGTVLNFSANKKNVQLNVSDCRLKGYEGKNINCSFEYVVKSASKNLIYLCPKDYRTVKVNIDGNKVSGKELGQFCLYFSMYGFGESRIEVSHHLDDESFVKGNTYWVR